MELKGLLKINSKTFPGVVQMHVAMADPHQQAEQVAEIMTHAGLYADDEIVSSICSLVASGTPLPQELGSPKAIYGHIFAALHQDDDAHDTCSLTACLNPLHPGPCKGWKGTLFKTAPAAFHALEKAKADKANATRVKKIEDLKAKGLPIPKKLLTPILPKPHPHAGQTANSATGEAHEAGKAVTESAGVHVNAPGKVTLGQAVKKLGTDATAEKGPKGKKPSVMSKGIATVIAQEKVTPQYKLDKAATITPEQWAGLTGDEKSIIRGELSKISIHGFGPQQEKANALLAKLPAHAAAPDVAEAEVDAVKAKLGDHLGKGEHVKVVKPKTFAEAKADGTLAKVGQEIADKAKAEGHKPEVKQAAEVGAHHSAVKPSNVKEGIEQAAKDAHAEKVAKAKADLAEALKGKTPVIKAMEEAAKAPEPKKSDAPKPLPKHVDDAIAMANGTAPGASWSKNHLAAYQKLTPEEFQALSPDVQSKITAELEKAKTKFLDPKKVKASQELLAKFNAGGPKPKIENVGEIGFQQHYNDHSVTPSQAKAAVKDVPPEGLFVASQKLVGLDDKDNPDSPQLAGEAMDRAKAAVDSQTKLYSPEVLNDPEVKAAVVKAKDAVGQFYYAGAVGKAKSNTYSKIGTALASDTDLSPIQRAALQKYQAYLLDHPVDTSGEHLGKLGSEGVNAGADLNKVLQAKLKAVNAPKSDEMSPAQVKSTVLGLLGPDAVKDQFKPNFGEFNDAVVKGKVQAAEVLKDYPEGVADNPQVAAKAVAMAQAATELHNQHLTMTKTVAHVEKHHMAAIKNMKDVNGNTIGPDQVKIIAKHAEMLGKANPTGHTIPEMATKLEQAKADLKAAADAAKAKLGPQEPVTLSDYDKDLVGYAFRDAWTKAASKAVSFGTDYTTRQKMKANEDYPGLTQDLGSLKALVGEVALAHAAERIAELNVPTDPDTGHKIMGTPEAVAWAAAMGHTSSVENQYSILHKTTQAKLDKIRTEAGLKKRALPKFDNTAVKKAAAETAFYKSIHYGAPNYGKAYSAKSYMLAKVGDKLGVKHQSTSEKKAEKLAATIKKEGTPGTVSPSGKYVPPPTTQPTKDQFPSASKAGTSPSAESAAKYGFTFQAAPPTKVGAWPGDQGGAYVTNPADLAEAQRILSNPDLQHGLAAQKQFKWSIDNMDGKGAPSGAKGSLYNYTGSGYNAVNTKLNGLPPGTKKTGSQTVANIDKGMEASPAPEEDLVLYRGFKDPHGVFSSGKWNDVNVAGMEWSQKSYSSTSGNLVTAQSFAGYSGVVMRVIVPKAMKVKGINAKGGMHPGEAEIILQRGLRYRVVADHGKHGQTRYIDVMVVPDPYAQAE